MATMTISRSDLDIAEDIHKFIRTYAPLVQARPFIEAEVHEGRVTLRGHTRSPQARRVLVDNVPDIAGVVALDASQLYDDETLRLELGKVLPRGVRVRVNFGGVAVGGVLPAGTTAEDISAAIKRVPGVRADKLVLQFD